MNIILSLVYLVSGILVFALRPNRPATWGILISHIGLAVFFNYPITIFLVGAYFIHLSLSLFEEKTSRKRYLIPYGISIVLFVLFLLNLKIVQPLSYLFALLGIVHFVFETIKTRYKSQQALPRQRAKLLIAAFILTLFFLALAAIAYASNLIPYYPLLIIAAAFLPLAISYGVLHYNLFEADEIIKRSLLYILTMIIIASIYGLFLYLSDLYLEGLIFSQNQIFLLGVILFFLFYFKNIKRPIQATLDKIFYRKRGNIQVVFSQVRDKLSVIMDIELVINTVINILRTRLFVENANVFIYQEKENLFQNYDGTLKLKKDSELIKLTEEKKKLFSNDEIMHNPKLSKSKIKVMAQMAQIEAVFIIPFYFRKKMLGLISLGKSQAGESLNLMDIELLEIVANQTGVALENAKLYDHFGRAKRKLEELNATLEQKVTERTGELQEKNIALQETNEKIQNSTQHKAEFLSSMSHELRTPLNGILGFSDLILGGIYGEAPEKVKGTLSELHINGQILLRMINNILDYSKIEAKKMELRKEEFSAKDIAKSTIQEFNLEIQKKGLKLETNIETTKTPAYGDTKRVSGILSNLLSNAINATEKGEIILNIAPKNQELVFSVSDTGSGIARDRLEKIFFEYEDAESFLKKTHRGAGLGLPISRKFAELHGGTLTVKSRPNKGSTFTFTLPNKK